MWSIMDHYKGFVFSSKCKLELCMGWHDLKIFILATSWIETGWEQEWKQGDHSEGY